MKRNSIFFLLLVLFLNLYCCSPEQTQEKEILATVNDFNLKLVEFQRQLAAELEMDKDYKLTEEAKKDFLAGMIRKELLIQEAKKLGLDKKEQFMKAIERYWESTLIRDLMEIKGKEICKRILISQKEIAAFYDEMKKSEEEELPPFDELREKIYDKLKEKKKTRMMKQWINDLTKNAKIEINNELLYGN